jgi:hypothetical protein
MILFLSGRQSFPSDAVNLVSKFLDSGAIILLNKELLSHINSHKQRELSHQDFHSCVYWYKIL